MNPNENKDFPGNEKNISDYEKLIIDFSLGIRSPQTAEEQKLFDEIKEIHAKGHIVEIPNEII